MLPAAIVLYTAAKCEPSADEATDDHDALPREFAPSTSCPNQWKCKLTRRCRGGAIKPAPSDDEASADQIGCCRAALSQCTAGIGGSINIATIHSRHQFGAIRGRCDTGPKLLPRLLAVCFVQLVPALTESVDLAVP